MSDLLYLGIGVGLFLGLGALFLRGARRRPDAVVPGSTREDRS